MADALVDGAVSDLGTDDVPDDEGLYEVFVRSYLVPRVMPHGSIRNVQAMIDRLLS